MLCSQARLADHFGGKLHIGYMLIRERLEDMKVCIPFKKKRHVPVWYTLIMSLRGLLQGLAGKLEEMKVCVG